MIHRLIIHMIHRLIMRMIIQMIIHRQLTDAEKLRKVVVELVDTERTYVKHLSYLMQVGTIIIFKRVIIFHIIIFATKIRT